MPHCSPSSRSEPSQGLRTVGRGLKRDGTKWLRDAFSKCCLSNSRRQSELRAGIRDGTEARQTSHPSGSLQASRGTEINQITMQLNLHLQPQ